MQKHYTEPQFALVKTGESNKVFFEGSGPASPTATLQSFTKTQGSWS